MNGNSLCARASPVRDRKGDREKRKGTGVYPAKYESGADADGRFTKTIRLGDSGQETEWSTSYTDFAGRASQTVQAHESGTPAVFQNVYNTKAQLVRTVDPDGVTSLFEYNSLGEQVTSAVDVDQDGEIDRGGNDRVTETASSYATRSGKTVRRTVEQGYLTDGNATPTPLRITETSVDGLDTWSTLAGLTTHSSTLLQGNGNSTTTVTNPDGTQEVTVITAGRRTSITRLDATAGQVTQTTYASDPFGRVSSQTDARTGTTTFTWFNDGQMASTTTPAPGDGSAAQTTSFTCDANGRPDTTTLPDGGVVDQDYSSTGNLLHQEGARTYPVTYTYDSQGRMRTTTTAGGVTTWNFHAASGRLAQKIHGDGHGPAYTYTPAGRLLTRTSGRGTVTTYAYNLAGDLAGIDYSDDTPDVAYTSTRRGQVATATKGGSTTTYSYNAAGQPELEQVAGGVLDAVTVDPGYDALLRRTTLNASGPGWTSQQSYAYDQAGRLGTIASGNQSITYGYLANSNLLATTQSATGGNTILSTTRTWDNLNRLQAISNAASSLNQTFAYTYNTANQRTQVTRDDGTHWDYGYDALGQVTGAVQKQSGGTPFAGRTFGYAYDNIGTRTSATFSGTGANTHTIGYTKASGDGTQYATISNPGVALVTGEADPAASVTVNGVAAQARQSSFFAHELTVNNSNGPASAAAEISATLGETTETEQRHAFVPAATANLTYDLDGNLTFDGFLDYTWDAENRLLTVRTRPGLAPAGSSLKDFRQEMTYDHSGRRIRRTAYYTINGTEHRATDDLFVYDGWNQIAVLDARTRLPRQTFVWGLDLSGTLQGAGGVGGLALIRDVPSGTNHFVSYDGNGNVMGLADAATGEQTADYVYDAFGNLLAAKGTFAMRNSWRFSTKIQDDAIGLYYYGFRYYDPTSGKRPNRDPFEEKGGANLYAAFRNNPSQMLDLFGLWARDVHYTATKLWAMAIAGSYPEQAAEMVAAADDAVDFGFTSFLPLIGDQSFHFNRNLNGGPDSRSLHFADYKRRAETLCTKRLGNDSPEMAAVQLGTALHPMQDVVAHGDYGMWMPGIVYIFHNQFSPQRVYGDPTDYPDTTWLDAVGSPDGVPTGNAIRVINNAGFDYAIYTPGQRRWKLTKERTESVLADFRSYVKANGGCECKKFFGLN